jgi:hypothetical protein
VDWSAQQLGDLIEKATNGQDRLTRFHLDQEVDVTSWTASPRATDPNTRTLVIPRRRAMREMGSR